QKLQGALSDLEFEKGIFASATDYTKPAKSYADSSFENPMQKEIDLFHVRPSTELDEKGRIKKFVINLVMITPDYNHGTFNPVWTKDSIEKLRHEIGENQPISLQIDRFYTSEGVIDCLMRDFTYHNQPITINIHDEHAEGCWLLHEK